MLTMPKFMVRRNPAQPANALPVSEPPILSPRKAEIVRRIMEAATELLVVASRELHIPIPLQVYSMIQASLERSLSHKTDAEIDGLINQFLDAGKALLAIGGRDDDSGGVDQNRDRASGPVCDGGSPCSVPDGVSDQPVDQTRNDPSGGAESNDQNTGAVGVAPIGHAGTNQPDQSGASESGR